MTNPEWLPDWHDASQYNLEASSPIQLAWEFLRRNPDYQRDFEVLVALFNRENGIYNPRKENHEEAVAKVFEFYEKYHLKDGVFPPSPNDSSAELSFKAGWSPAYIPHYEYFEDMGREQGSLSPRCPEEIVLRLDLRVPVQAQLDQLEAFIREKSADYQEAKRHHIAKLPYYLRLLDAEQAGASLKEMAQVIYPEKSDIYPDFQGSNSAGKALKAAKLFRDRNYFYLQFSSA